MNPLKKLINWGQRKSPWIIHFNAGACNGCDIEVVDALTPRFDLERFGIVQKGSPRHADVLVCTGSVTLQTADRLSMIYEQMPEPKFVVAVGACACAGGVFADCYCVKGGIDSVIPVSAYVPGCAARPEAIIDGVVKLLSTLKNKDLAPKTPLVINSEDQLDNMLDEANYAVFGSDTENFQHIDGSNINSFNNASLKENVKEFEDTVIIKGKDVLTNLEAIKNSLEKDVISDENTDNHEHPAEKNMFDLADVDFDPQKFYEEHKHEFSLLSEMIENEEEEKKND